MGRRSATQSGARARSLRTIVVTAVIGVVLGTLIAPAVAGAEALGPKVGVTAGARLLWETPAEQQADVNYAAATGAKWFGIDVDWPSIQPKRKQWNWTYTDHVVRLARARGLQIVGTLAYSPKWASGPTCPINNTHCLPTDLAAYAVFAKAAAQRYGNNGAGDLKGSITRWQIWNEPNHYPFVQAPVDPGWYTRLLQASYPAIKSADYFSTVLAGGTSPAGNDPNGRDIAPATFLQYIYGFGGKGYFDGFAHHPSSFPCDPMTPADWNSFLQSASIYWVMAAHGDGAKKVWGTEVGVPTGADVGTCAGGNGSSVTEPVQAMLTARILSSWTVDFGAFTGPLIWYQVRDNGTNPMVWDDHLGLLRRDYSAKPSYSVFSSMMRG